ITGLSLQNSLTQAVNPQLDIAYHLSEAWAIDLLVGYAFGGTTDLQCQAQNPGATATGSQGCSGTHSIFKGTQVTTQNSSGSNRSFSDLPNLWILNGPNAELGLRWEPIYGKLSLLTELPIHFKWYLQAAAGVAQFSRTSVDFCATYDPNAAGGQGDCAQNASGYETAYQTQYSWLGSVATGLRFMFLGRGGLTLGLRDYLWGDSYATSFTANQFGSTPPAPTAHGVTSSLFADIGLGWTF
ncbi:MAG: outer membrane beta-barrel domain-containing protein, partial [Deltaproteobacteria bacterium]